MIAAEGDAVARYEVSSQILCAASPYFQASFGPDSQFISAQRVRRAAMRGQPRAEIELDDDPEAMGIVLKVLCFRHHEVPDVLSLPKIRKLAIIADKYELEAVLRPWVSKWSEVSKLNILLSGHEDWLFISWVFGYEGIFKDCTRALTRRDAAALGKVCNRMPHVVLGMFLGPGPVQYLCVSRGAGKIATVTRYKTTGSLQTSTGQAQTRTHNLLLLVPQPKGNV